jgi:LysR family nitrogen assimilation transcriptional regulator
MDIRQLGYFVQVADLGSFTRAAQVLRVAQPALSRQVRSLEVELRQRLFDRNGRGVVPTEAGKRLLAHARGILQQFARARQELDEERGAASGRLALGLPPSISRNLTVPLVEAFRARLPRASLAVVEGLSVYALEWLLQGRIDIAAVYNATPSPDVELLPVLEEALHLVSPRAPGRATAPRPVTLAQLATRELVIPSRPHAIRMRVETALASAGLKPRIALEIESVPAILDLVARLKLHAVLPLNAARSGDAAPDVAMHPIGTPPLTTTLWIATSAQRPRGPLLDQGAQLLQEVLSDSAGGAVPG